MISFAIGQRFCPFGIRILCSFVLTNPGPDSLTKQRQDCNSLCSRRLLANCQTMFSKISLPSALTSSFLARSFQTVNVNPLKSPWNVCRKLVFNQGKSKQTLAGQKQEVLWHRFALAVTYTSLQIHGLHWESSRRLLHGILFPGTHVTY